MNARTAELIRRMQYTPRSARGTDRADAAELNTLLSEIDRAPEIERTPRSTPTPSPFTQPRLIPTLAAPAAIPGPAHTEARTPALAPAPSAAALAAVGAAKAMVPALLPAQALPPPLPHLRAKAGRGDPSSPAIEVTLPLPLSAPPRSLDEALHGVAALPFHRQDPVHVAPSEARDTGRPAEDVADRRWLSGLTWSLIAGAMAIALASPPASTWLSKHVPEVVRGLEAQVRGAAARRAARETQATPRATPEVHADAESKAARQPSTPPAASEPQVTSLVGVDVLLNQAAKDAVAKSASEPPRPLCTQLKGKVTAVRGGRMDRRRLRVALGQVKPVASSCNGLFKAEDDAARVTMAWLVESSGHVRWARAKHPSDAREPAYVCARDSLREARFPRPRGGAAKLEGVITFKAKAAP